MIAALCLLLVGCEPVKEEYCLQPEHRLEQPCVAVLTTTTTLPAQWHSEPE